MSVNSSSFDDLPPHLSSNTSFHRLTNTCSSFKISIYIFSALFVMYILLILPLFILVLYLGYQRWRKQSSSSTMLSHSDHFTYHSIVTQLVELLGLVSFFIGSYTDLPDMLIVGVSILSLTSLGQALFHLLTCVERYLAVVHPVTYLGLRQARGVRIRNMSIGCVWLMSFICLASLYIASIKFNMILYYCVLVFLIIVTSFCSISVLCALKRPGPGEVGGNREQVDKSKQRAFHTIMAIMGALLIRFGGDLVSSAIQTSVVASANDTCVGKMSAFWLSLPSSLVLPLLYLHRAGKLQCFKQKNESG